MGKKVKFEQLLSNWFIAALLLLLINGFWIRIPIIQNIILASIGIILLLYPAMPDSI